MTSIEGIVTLKSASSRTSSLSAGRDRSSSLTTRTCSSPPGELSFSALDEPDQTDGSHHRSSWQSSSCPLCVVQQVLLQRNSLPQQVLPPQLQPLPPAQTSAPAPARVGSPDSFASLFGPQSISEQTTHVAQSDPIIFSSIAAYEPVATRVRIRAQRRSSRPDLNPRAALDPMAEDADRASYEWLEARYGPAHPEDDVPSLWPDVQHASAGVEQQYGKDRPRNVRMLC